MPTVPAPSVPGLAHDDDRSSEQRHEDVRPMRETVPEGVEAGHRRPLSADPPFLVDHASHGAETTRAADAAEILTGRPAPGSVPLAPGEVTAAREPRRR